MAEQERSKKQRKIYSTKYIEQLINDRNNGYEIDFEPFYMRDLDLRAENIPFEMTQEEVEEYQKCYDDPLYYASTYAKFMTDYGMKIVELRDYQKKIISTATEEVYDEERDLFLPVNRNIVLCCSRQTGKCVTPWTSINYRKGDLSTSKQDFIFNVESGYVGNTLCRRIKKILYKLYNKGLCKSLVGHLIQFVENIEYSGYDFDEDDISKKIIDGYELDGLQLETDSGFSAATDLYVTQPYHVHCIRTKSGLELECADNHIVFDDTFNEVFVKDLRIGDKIITKNGTDEIVYTHRYPFKVTMRDFTIDDDNHRYYTNDILSHNTTTIAVFLSWMLIFHVDRNILIAANKEKTAIEIVDKILNIFKGLPFWLKPGTVQWGKTQIQLDNGSKILSTATTNTASIGFTIHCVLLDEFAHIPDTIVNNFWRSVYPTLSSSDISQCIIASTPNGTTNKYFEIWDGAINKRNSFVPIRVDYWEFPGHDEEWAKKIKADFGEEEFAQEYALQFDKHSQMLMKADDMRFTERLVREYVNKTVYVNNQFVNDEHITWHPDFDPNSIGENDMFVMLIDLAEGNGEKDERLQKKEKTPDANTIHIFKVVLNSISNIRKYSYQSCGIKDCVRFVQVGKYVNSSEDEQQTARICAALSYSLFKDNERNNVRVMVEMNFNGKSFFEEFKKSPMYSDATVLKTFHRKPIPGENQKRKRGFLTTSNKENYCIKGNKLIGMRRTIVTCKDTFDQMKAFGYVRGKLKGIACHDDLSMPVFNHIPRMLDEKTFLSWIEEYLYFKADKAKVYAINQIIQQWALDNPEMSDDTFNALYDLDDNQPVINPESAYSMTYSQIMNGGFNPYGLDYNGIYTEYDSRVNYRNIFP